MNVKSEMSHRVMVPEFASVSVHRTLMFQEVKRRGHEGYESLHR